MRQEITSAPSVVTGLTASTRYTLQNKSRHPLYIDIAVASPADSGNAFIIKPFNFATVIRTAAEEVYVWTSSADDDGSIVYSEAA